MKSIFYRDKIVFWSYPYPLASVARLPDLLAEQVAEVRPERWPPELMLSSGEVLFVPQAERQNLELFARINRIPLVRRTDIWSLLCAPFAAIDYGVEDRAATLRLLATAGLSAMEAEKIRKKIHKKMSRYRATGDWVDLAHRDVLNAYGVGETSFWPFTRAAKRRFYNWTHRLSAHAPATPMPPANREERLRIKISDMAFVLPEIQMGEGHADPDLYKQAEAVKQKLTHNVLTAYAEPHRHYHNDRQLLRMMDAIDTIDLNREEKLTLRLTALYHAIIYDPQRDDNEEQSAALLEQELLSLMPEAPLREAARLIRRTKYYLSPATVLEKAWADIYLLIMAQDEQTYEDYVDALRQEYSHIPYADWRAARLDFLQPLDAHARKQGKLYAHFQPMHEQQALLNIAWELAQLQG